MLFVAVFFFFNDTATTEIYTLSLHDALPICRHDQTARRPRAGPVDLPGGDPAGEAGRGARSRGPDRREMGRSEEHTSELQSRQYLVCRLLLEKKKKKKIIKKIIIDDCTIIYR